MSGLRISGAGRLLMPGAGLRAARERPSFALYLVALALFPFKWLSPFSHQQAGWIDIFVAAAVAVWIIEWVRDRRRVQLRLPHLLYAAYLVAGVLSALAASDRSTAAENVLIMGELVMLAVLTADFARAAEQRSAIVRVIFLVTIVIGAETAVALALFYAGIDSSLVGVYGVQLQPTHLYARVAAGFYSPPLLGSFCIFASALLARPDANLSTGSRRIAQAILVVVVLFTVSRAAIGFALALLIRATGGRASRTVPAVAAAAGLMVALTLVTVHLDASHPARSTARPLERAGNQRLEGLTSSADTLADHPLVGSGPGSLPGRFEDAGSRPHFTPLNVAATLGIPAALALGALVVVLWVRRRRPTDLPTWSGLAGLAIDGIGQDADHFRHVWILLGFADADRREPTR